MVADAGRAAFALDDELAFANSLEPLLPIAFRLANGMLRNRTDAEDAVQEAAMKAWRKRSSFRAGSDPKPWFLAIVANECKMHRRRRVWNPLEGLAPEPEAATEIASQMRWTASGPDSTVSIASRDWCSCCGSTWISRTKTSAARWAFPGPPRGSACIALSTSCGP